jgi:Transposase IS116/IS110/IS902 family
MDMQRFPSADSLVSWAGMCPRSDESAGKRRSTRIRKGALWLKTTLISKPPGPPFAPRIPICVSCFTASKRGAMKAIVAVAASMLRSAYHMLSRRVPYQDLGPAHFDSRNRARTTSRLLKRLKELGIEVVQTPWNLFLLAEDRGIGARFCCRAAPARCPWTAGAAQYPAHRSSMYSSLQRPQELANLYETGLARAQRRSRIFTAFVGFVVFREPAAPARLLVSPRVRH